MSTTSAEMYYVDYINGNDNNPGTISLPWKHCPDMEITWGHCSWEGNSKTLQNGDTVYFKCGSIWKNSMLNPKTSGITYTFYGTGALPVISPAYNPSSLPWTLKKGTTIWYTASSSVPLGCWYNNVALNWSTNTKNPLSMQWYAEASGSNYIMYVNLGSASTTPSNEGFLLVTQNHPYSVYIGSSVSNLTFKNLELSFAARGIEIENTSGNSYIISNCKIHDMENYTGSNHTSGQEMPIPQGIAGSLKSDITITNNEIYNIGASNLLSSNGNVLGHGIYLGAGVTNVSIEYNKIYSICGAGVQIYALSSEGKKSSDVKAHMNLIFNTGVGMFVFDADNMQIYNNTFYSIRDYGIALGGSNPTGINVRNNILAQIGIVAVYCQSGSSMASFSGLDYNLYYNTNSTKSMINTGSGNYRYIDLNSYKQQYNNAYDSHSLSLKDPLFVNVASYDFHLRYDSPCINAGTNIGLSTDYDGHPVPQGSGVEIGAFEYYINPPRLFQISYLFSMLNN